MQSTQELVHKIEERKVYSANSNVWALYHRVDIDTRAKLAKGSFSLCCDDTRLTDIVFTLASGLVMQGSRTSHGHIYKWLPGEQWIEANFVPLIEGRDSFGERVTQSQYDECLQALIAFYGKPTHTQGSELNYHIVPGVRTIRDTFENGEVEEHQVPIDAYLRIHLRAYVPKEEPAVVALQPPKQSLIRRLLGHLCN